LIFPPYRPYWGNLCKNVSPLFAEEKIAHSGQSVKKQGSFFVLFFLAKQTFEGFAYFFVWFFVIYEPILSFFLVFLYFLTLFNII